MITQSTEIAEKDSDKISKLLWIIKMLILVFRGWAM